MQKLLGRLTGSVWFTTVMYVRGYTESISASFLRTIHKMPECFCVPFVLILITDHKMIEGEKKSLFIIFL